MKPSDCAALPRFPIGHPNQRLRRAQKSDSALGFPGERSGGGVLTAANRCARAAGGFSLVEIVLALGIVAFALIAILGLIPVGLSSLKESVEDSVTSLVIGHVQESLVGRPFIAGNVGPLFYDSDGRYVGDAANDTRNYYRVDVTLAPPAQPPPDTNLLVASVTLSWPIDGSGNAPQNYQTSFYVAPLTGPGWRTLDPSFEPKIGL